VTPSQRRELLSIPYRIGGRDHTGIDCLGVVLHVLRLQGKRPMDPWRQLLSAYRTRSLCSISAFPQGWSRQHPPFDWRDGDVLLFHDDHSWSAVVDDGHLWSANPRTGVWNKDLNRLVKQPNEVWRHTGC